MKNISHVFFDLDHTLWDFERNSALAFQQIFSEHHISVDFPAFLKEYKPINLAYWKLYREERISKEKLRYSRLREAFDLLEYTISDELINQLSKDYINALPNHNFLMDGAMEVLEYLKPKYQLHIITNGFKEVQHLKMEKSKIMHFFDEVITSESVGVKKPNPLVFHHALEKANAKAENSVMIGDSLEADIEGAKACDFLTIFYNFEKRKGLSENITSVHHLLEIKQYL